MCSSWTHCIFIPCILPGHTIYLSHVLTLYTKSIHTMCSSWKHSLVRQFVYTLTQSLFILCVPQFYPNHVFTLCTHLNQTMCKPWTHSLSIPCALPWAHSLSIPCVHPEHTIYLYHVFTMDLHSFHSMCSPLNTHPIILGVLSFSTLVGTFCIAYKYKQQDCGHSDVWLQPKLFSLNTQFTYTMCSSRYITLTVI